MADVTGSFGQEEVVLNNAATEATLKQLLGAMQIVAAKAKSEFKNQAELDKALGNLAKTTKDQVRALYGSPFSVDYTDEGLEITRRRKREMHKRTI